MNELEQKHVEFRYLQHITNLKLQGKTTCDH